MVNELNKNQINRKLIKIQQHSSNYQVVKDNYFVGLLTKLKN